LWFLRWLQEQLLRSRADVLRSRADVLRSRACFVLRSRPELLQIELLPFELPFELLQEPLPPVAVLQEPLQQVLQFGPELLCSGPELLRSRSELRRPGCSDLRRSSRCVLQLIE
jgi:hypothetical protein